jgi:ferredoxin
MAVIVDLSLCDGCANCVESCPMAAILIVDGKASVDEDACSDCGACESECPTGAIQSQ